MIDVNKMTIIELKEYVNNLTNEEFEKFEKEVDLSDFDADLEPIMLLTSSRLYDYLKYRDQDKMTVEM